LRVGDAISVPGAGGNPVRFAGVQLGSGLDLRTDVVPATRLATSGIATLPSSVDALLSSTNASDTPLARQGLALQGKVQVVGANSVSFVTRDALGRTLQVTQPLLADIRLADQGCSQYSVDLGRVREDYALQSNAYGQWFANTRVLCGMPLGLTLEGHGEYLNQQGGTVGFGLARRLSSGWLARLSFEHTNPLFDLNVRTLVQSAGFRRVGTAATADPTLRSTVASLGVKVGERNDLAVVYAAETTQADVTAALVALTQRMRVGAFNSVTMTAGQSLAATARILSVYLSFTRAFGARTPRSSGLPGLDFIRAPQRLLVE
jgi:outer membrane usher protein FimD/PapC